MTSMDPSASSPFSAEYAPGSDDPAAPRSLWWDTVELFVERAGERLNPILVKEARQALKSKQFIITFTLLLLAGWVWSMFGVAWLSPGIYFAPGGRFMLVGYFVVLSVPVLVTVPFSAFRSLAAEREDGTFELLSITALSSRQIVTGKLGSAVLQMLVYYSALAPCIAFTYLLRGIDIITILFLLFYTFVASIVLSAFGLVVATVTRARHWQVLLSVLLLIGLLVVTVIWTTSFVGMTLNFGAMGFDDADFWLAQAAIVTFCISHAILFIMFAAAQISFASDNRSTRVRIMLLVQQVLWLGWMSFFWIRSEDFDLVFLLTSVAGIYWFVAGAFMMGETGALSPRVKRSLPQSFLGRMCFTWFNPGSGTGYTFATANLLTLVLVTLIAGLTAEITGLARAFRGMNWFGFALLTAAYPIAYLGIGRLIALVLRRLGRVTMLLTVLLNGFLVVIGCALPLFAEAWLKGPANISYSMLQMTNWAWTMAEIADNGLELVSIVPITVLVTAGVVFLLNLVFTMFEVEQTRAATPDRVLQDEQSLHPERADKPQKSSPWDEPETAEESDR
jgi:ABC-type transport system involved in cytochrome c biogenesis permease component